MASLPPQSSSAQRPSSTRRDSTFASVDDTSVSEQPKESIDRSITSTDSQIVLLDNSTEDTAESIPSVQETATQTKPPEDDETRRCWICFSDETEDNELSSEWRSPCPCALTAHESCLLDWVADLEAPKPHGAKPKIQCPQCKADIVVARPTNYIVKGAQALDRVTGKLIVPGVATSIVGSMLAGAWFHGVASLYFIFGREDFDILMSGEGPESLGKFGVASLAGFPFLLILSRTTLADPLLTAIPILTIAFHIPSSDALKTSAPLWPPSAAMAFSMFPFVRGAYNQTYYWLFAERLKKWTKKVQPRAGEDNPEGNNGGEENNAGPEVVEIELGLDIQMVEVDDDGNEIEPGQEDHQPQPAQGQEAADANPQNDQAAIAAGAANDNGNNAPAQQPQEPAAAAPANRGNQLLISTSRVVDTIVGALAFPLLASVMGRLIKLGLPRSWSHGGYNRRPGLLATTWGRSLVGGCLLVVMKDTLQVYTRYRIAQDHMKRRVINYDRTKRGSGKK